MHFRELSSKLWRESAEQRSTRPARVSYIGVFVVPVVVTILLPLILVVELGLLLYRELFWWKYDVVGAAGEKRRIWSRIFAGLLMQQPLRWAAGLLSGVAVFSLATGGLWWPPLLIACVLNLLNERLYRSAP